jgi:predicted phage terminase large subunit-like protein
VLTGEVLEGFVNSVLASRFDQAAPTPNCHREWWSLCTGKDRFVAIAAPRGFAKSTAITHCYTLGALLFRERRFALIVSDTETQAVLFLQDIKKEIQDNEDLIKLFRIKQGENGKVALVKDSESDFIVECDDGWQFRLMAKGSEQKVRGLKWGSKRPDLIICDDLENDEIVLNKDRREKFRKWFYGALLPCRSDNGIVRVVGTILHMDSLLERLMPETQLATIRKHKLLIREELKEWTEWPVPWKSVKYRAHNSDFSELLWKERRNKTWLQSERQKYVDMGLPEIYAQEYLNVPIDESTAYFKRADFLSMRDDDKGRTKKYYITADLAISEDERADYSVFTVGGIDSDGILHVTFSIRERLDGKEIVECIMQLQKRYNPEAFGIEEGQISKSLGPFLRDLMVRSNRYINLIPMKHLSKDKMTRARSIQARMRAGAVKFDKEGLWYQTLEDECLRFPRDKHDDQVDALAYLGLLVDKMIDAPTPKEEEDELWEEEMAEYNLNSLNNGRSAITGY